MNIPLRLVWSVLVGLLAVGSVLACDGGLPSPVSQRSSIKPVPTSAPSELPTPPSTFTPAATPAPSPTPAAESTLAATAEPEPTAIPTVASSGTTPPPKLVIAVSRISEDPPPYDRDDWGDWIDEDGDCQNTRHEVLIEESLVPVAYKNDRECQVLSGEWFGAFTATTVTDASDLDIDHFVPLKNAHLSGGWAWTPERKESYANSLDSPDHLVAVTNSANRSKGAKGPDEWRPPNETYWCDYAIAWIELKRTWGLTATPQEVEALKEMLATCANPPELTALEDDPSAAPAAPTLGLPKVDTYASCEEAEMAGEEPAQGAKGSGRGFPEAMVPSARDGDGDGIVCEN